MISIIFDIDGTLLESSHFDTDLFIQAVRDILGEVHIHDDWNDYTHVTDTGILNQIFLENQIQETESLFNEIRNHFGELIQNYLQQHPCQPTKGAPELLQRLKDDNHLQCGIATGGWEHTAKMKLSSAKLCFPMFPLKSSDTHYERKEIMISCKKSFTTPSSKVIYVGDGPWDKIASERLGWSFIGLGERLKDQCSVWIPNLSLPFWEKAFLKSCLNN